MNTEQRAKFIKLIEFLEALPPRKFNFSSVVEKFTEGDCASVGCAIGWMPAVFPNELEWRKHEGPLYRVARKDGGSTSYADMAEEFFGMPENHKYIFSPDGQHDVHPELTKCGDFATPKEVAEMMKEYLALIDAKSDRFGESAGYYEGYEDYEDY